MAKKKQRNTNKDIHKVFVDSVKKVAKMLEKHPSEVTKAELTANDPNELNEWEIRKVGGFTNLRKTYFAPPVKLNTYKHGSRIIASHRNKLDKFYGTEQFMTEEILKTIKEFFKSNSIRMHKPVKAKSRKPQKKSRTIFAHLSDTHYGANIEREEVGNLNEYNWTVAARRTALFVDQVMSYKPHYREDTDLVVGINGDILAGMIHDQEWFADLLTIQFAGTLDILVQAISYLAKDFKSIVVECSPGNHGRAMHKTSKNRATTHKWDSYETLVYVAVKEVLERSHKNVKVNVPKTPFNIINIYGHNIFMTHGDTVIDVGNPGHSLNMKSINEQINKLNASELVSKSVDVVVVGHVHTPTVQQTESGCMLVINGCLSGLDPFANSIGIFASNPTQQLFEITKEHSVGDIRFIQVKDADDKKSLDKIIKPFKAKW